MSAPPDPLDAYRGRVVLVLGATGFVGRWVARALTHAGAVVYGTVRDPNRASDVFERYGIRCTPLCTDLSVDGSVRSLIREVQPVITFNLCGYGVDRGERVDALSWKLNRDLVSVLCAVVAAEADSGWDGLQLVHVGSALEYGGVGGDLSEDGAVAPTTTYGRSKLAGTRAVSEAVDSHGLRAVAARLFTVYGPGEHEGRLLPSLIHAAGLREPLPLTSGEQRRDFTYVADVAEGLLRLGATRRCHAIVNLATGVLTPVRAFAEAAAHRLGMSQGLLQFGELPVREEEMSHEPVCVRRLQAATGWAPTTTIVDGIEQTAAFLRATRGGTHS